MNAALGTKIADNREQVHIQQAWMDIDRLVETRLLLCANSGGGKSWAVRRLLEQTHGHVQHLVLDPEGEFATLRERFDYVLAGEGGDCAAEPRSAHLLARKLLELGVSAICDIDELKRHERLAFVNAFVNALVTAPKRLWRPVLVVVDEAHVFCPERGKAESAGAIIDLATRGRKRGMCAVLATQRLSKLRKDAAAECNNVLIGRTGLDVDIARAGDMLGLTKRTDRQALRLLEPGQFHAFGPAMPDGITRLMVGSVATTHPTVGSRMAAVPPPPTDRIRKVLAGLADLPEAAEQEQEDNAALRREVASLKAKLRAQPTGDTLTVEEADRREQRRLSQLQAETARLRSGLDTARASLVRWQTWANGVVPVLNAAGKASTELDALLAVEMEEDEEPAAPAPQPVKPQPTRVLPLGVRGEPPSRPQQAILDTTAELHALGIASPSRSHVAAFAGVSPKSSSFANNLGSLRTRGLLDYPGKQLVRLTDEGRAWAADVDVPLTRHDLRSRWIASVSIPQARILTTLFHCGPNAQSRTGLAGAVHASPTSSSFANNLGRLRSLGLIGYVKAPDGERQVLASADLFDEKEDRQREA